MSNELVVEGLTTGYIGGIPVLHSVDLTIASGQVVGIIGRNGAGKSTLAAAIAGILRPWSGRIAFKGWDCTRAAPRARVDRGLVTVPEGRRLFGQLTVIENLRVAAFGARKPFPPSLREEVAAEFPVIARKGRTRCRVLSGGEQQMVALARARVMAPEFLILDEPSLGLSPAVTMQLAGVIRQFAARGVGVALIEQNVALIEKVCETVRLLDEGRFVRDIPARELAQRESVLAAYLGAPAASDPGAPTPPGRDM